MTHSTAHQMQTHNRPTAPLFSYRGVTTRIWKRTESPNARLRWSVLIPGVVVALIFIYTTLFMAQLFLSVLILAGRIVGLSFRHTRVAHYSRDIKYLLK